MEARRSRKWFIPLGVVTIVASVLWTLLWGTVALLASSFGGDTSGWVIVSVALAFGVFAFVLGVSLVRGRQPGRWGWVAATGAAVALFALPVDSALDDREAAPVNRAVARAYMERSGLKNVEADCDIIEENRDGSESWTCDMGFSADYDVCHVDITRSQELIAADIDFCLIDDLEE